MSGALAAIAGGKGFSPLAVVASNVSRTQSGPTSDGTVTTTQSPNTTATGGVAPYTYAWTYVSGSVDFTVLSATAQNPTWEGVVPEGSNIAVWRVTVTDSVSATATADITVTLTWVQI